MTRHIPASSTRDSIRFETKWVPSGASIFLPPFEINRTDPGVMSGKSFRCLREHVSRCSRHPRQLAAGNLVVDDDVTLRLTRLERESLLLRVEGAKYRYASSLPLRRNGLR